VVLCKLSPTVLEDTLSNRWESASRELNKFMGVPEHAERITKDLQSRQRSFMMDTARIRGLLAEETTPHLLAVLIPSRGIQRVHVVRPEPSQETLA